MYMLRWLVEEGHANINTVSANGATPLLAALGEEMVNMEVVHFLFSSFGGGARERPRQPCLQQLCKGINPNGSTEAGGTDTYAFRLSLPFTLPSFVRLAHSPFYV
jgi:hypothetical protein